MKKIILILILLVGTYAGSIAQNTRVSEPPAKSKKTKNAEKKSSRSKRSDDAKMETRSDGLNKDGTPDMRLKKNKDAKAKQSNENIQPSDNRAGTILSIVKAR